MDLEELQPGMNGNQKGLRRVKTLMCCGIS